MKRAAQAAVRLTTGTEYEHTFALGSALLSVLETISCSFLSHWNNVKLQVREGKKGGLWVAS